MTWVRATDSGVTISVRVVPRASRNQVDGVLGESLKVRLQAPPVEGKANKALTRFLAKRLGVTASKVTVLSGQTDRNKRIRVEGVTVDAVRRALDDVSGE